MKVTSNQEETQGILVHRIYKPADPSNITQEEQSDVDEILRILDASVAGLPYANKLRRQFLNFRGRVNRDLHYDVNSYTKPHHRYVSIPSPLQHIQPGIPERITAPASRFKITEQEQQHVYDILLRLKASLEGVSSKDERCTQFTRLKGFLNRDLGYKVDIGKLVWEVTTVGNDGDPSGTAGSGGQKLVTFFEPVGQASGSSGGDTSTSVPPPPPV
ncbi:hypothetical protein H0H93_014062 [Arthromyces matolae]|nr:hypothetical protein H0H93_014062 [Arthromyces matolae]